MTEGGRIPRTVSPPGRVSSLNTGKRIAALRKEAGLSQEKLAERLAVSRSLIAQWESGAVRPDRRSIEAMAGLFGVSAESVACRDPAAEAELSACVPPGSAISGDMVPGLIEEFVRGLGEKERNIFIRRYHFFEKPSEIAERYGMNKGAVRTRLFRVRKKLRSFLISAEEKQRR